MATVDVTQAGTIVQDAGGNTEVTQAGAIVQDSGGKVDVTQAGVITYEGSATVDVTQAGIIIYEQPEEVSVTQAGIIQFIEGLHRNPELIVAFLSDTTAILQVRFIYPEWEELEYRVIRNSDSVVVFFDSKLSAEVDFGSISLSGLTDGVTYTGFVRARSSAGWTTEASVEFTPSAQLLPAGSNIFYRPLHAEPVSTSGDRTDLTAIQFCWDTLIWIDGMQIDIGAAIKLEIADPFVGSFTEIADEATLVGLNCINRNLSAFSDGWYIVRATTRDTFGIERTWYHPGFLIDTAEKATYFDQAPVNFNEWTHRDGVNLPWSIEATQSICGARVNDTFGRKFRQWGDPDSHINGPTIIGPIFPKGLLKARAATTGSIWAFDSPFGYYFGAENSEISIFSAVGNGFSVKAHVGFALVGPRGFGDFSGVALQAEFSVVVDVAENIFGLVGSNTIFKVPIVGVMSHPCLFENKNPSKWPFYLYVEHEWVDLAAGLVHVKAFLGTPYNLTIDEVVDVGFDMTTLECNCVGLGRFKIDNFNIFVGGDNGAGQFDNFMFSGDPGNCLDVCGVSIIPIPECPPGDPDCHPTPVPEPEPEPTPESEIEPCPPVIFNIESSNVIFLTSEKCPGDVIAFINDQGRPVVHILPCPPAGGIPPDTVDPVDPIDPSLQVRTGKASLVIPMMTLVADGNATTNVTSGEANLTIPMMTISASGGVAIEGDMEADVPFLESEGSGFVGEIGGSSGLIIPMMTIVSSIAELHQLPNCILACYAEQLEGSLNDNDPVASWTDISGVGNHPFQNTGSLQPLFDTVDPEFGWPAINFNGGAGGRYFQLPDLFNGAAAGEIFIVLRIPTDPPAAANDTRLYTFGSSGMDSHLTWTDTVIYDDFGSTARKTTVDPTPSLTTPRIYNVWSANNDWANNLDGSNLFNTATNTVGWNATPYIGRSVSGAGWLGTIFAIVAFSRKLSAGERIFALSTLAKYQSTRP